MPQAFNVEAQQPWIAFQSNGFLEEFRLRRDHQRITGGAQVVGGGHGDVVGSVNTSGIRLTVNWGPGSMGEYSGNFANDGTLSGHTFDRMHPLNQATWFTPAAFALVD